MVAVEVEEEVEENEEVEEDGRQICHVKTRKSCEVSTADGAR